jgi:hypothetical protein
MQRRKWILLLVLVALILSWYLLNNHPGWLPFRSSPTPEVATKTNQMVFNPEDGAVSAIQIEGQDGKIVLIKRGGDGSWVLEKPVSASADQAHSEAAASQVSAIKILKTLDADPGDNGTGLDKPDYKVTVTFQNDRVGILYVGDQTPIGTGYYARRDTGKVIIISPSGIEALLTILHSPPVATPTVP